MLYLYIKSFTQRPHEKIYLLLLENRSERLAVPDQVVCKELTFFVVASVRQAVLAAPPKVGPPHFPLIYLRRAVP